jgi:hypothetical protein
VMLGGRDDVGDTTGHAPSMSTQDLAGKA